MPVQFIGLITSFVVSVIIGIMILPVLKRLKVGQIVRDDGPKTHLSKSGTLTMGGVIMLLTILIIVAAFSIIYPKLLYILFITLGCGLVGLIDDYIKLVLKNPKGLSPRHKMLGLIAVSAVFVYLLVYVMKIGTDVIIPIWSQPFVLPATIYIIFNIFILIATTNSLNLTDGLDGLATGITIIIMTFFTVIAIREKNQEMIVFGSVVTGSCIGFLLFNLHPAKVFMGDTGSLALGGAIAAIAIMLKFPLHLAIVLCICVAEALSVILQVSYFKVTKKLNNGNGKRLFKMAPLHHHLELSGMKELNVVRLFWGITIIAAIFAYFV